MTPESRTLITDFLARWAEYLREEAQLRRAHAALLRDPLDEQDRTWQIDTYERTAAYHESRALDTEKARTEFLALESRIRDLESGLEAIARNPGECCPETGFTSGHIARGLLATRRKESLTPDPESGIHAPTP